MIINKYFKIGYVPTPKNACTSFKHVMFSMENNFTFKEYAINGKDFHIHNFHKTPPYCQNMLPSSDKQRIR